MKIAIIGAGNMGGSIARGFGKRKSDRRFGHHCVQSQRRKTRETEKRNFRASLSPTAIAEAATGADIVILWLSNRGLWNR